MTPLAAMAGRPGGIHGDSYVASTTLRKSRWVSTETGVPGLVLVGLDRVEDVALDVALVDLLIGPEVQTSVRVRLRVPEPGLSGDLLDERRMTASSDRAKRRVTAMLDASGATFKRISTAGRS